GLGQFSAGPLPCFDFAHENGDGAIFAEVNARADGFCAGATESATATATAALLCECRSAGSDEQACPEELHERTALEAEIEVDWLTSLFVSECDGFDGFEFGIHIAPPLKLGAVGRPSWSCHTRPTSGTAFGSISGL